MKNKIRKKILEVFDGIVENYFPYWVTSVESVRIKDITNGKVKCIVVIDDALANFRGTAEMSFYVLTSSHHPQVVTMNFEE